MFAPESRFIVVDDFGTMRKMLIKALNNIGYTDVSEADDGQTAWPMIQSAASEGKPYTVVITDWNMPNMTGLDLLKAIRSDDKTSNTPVIMVTAESEHKNIEMAVEAGVDDYIVKPFTTATVKEKIEKLYQKLSD